jgi:hypothetical protein
MRPTVAAASPTRSAICRRLMRGSRSSVNDIAARPHDDAHLYLRTGDTRGVSLVTRSGFYTGWAGPISLLPRVAEIGRVHNPLRNGVSFNCRVTAVILARRPGSTDIIASTDIPCFHAKPPCSAPSIGWRVKITVHN